MPNDKAKLERVVEVALANKRAQEDFMGLVGIKGHFTMVNATGAITKVVGEGFTVVAHPVTAGAFYIYFNKGEAPLAIYDIKISCFDVKAIGANASDYAADVAAVTLTGTTPNILCRGYVKSTRAVAAPLADTEFYFQVSGEYSTVGIY